VKKIILAVLMDAGMIMLVLSPVQMYIVVAPITVPMAAAERVREAVRWDFMLVIHNAMQNIRVVLLAALQETLNVKAYVKAQRISVLDFVRLNIGIVSALALMIKGLVIGQAIQPFLEQTDAWKVARPCASMM
jgi:hypothetical protein